MGGLVAALLTLSGLATMGVSRSQGEPAQPVAGGAEIARFEAARAALAAGDRAAFEALSASLQGQPLQVGLQGAELRARLDQAEAQEVTAFLARHRGTAAAERVRRDWLARLAREQRWAEYIAAYADNGSQARECWYRRALLATGREREAFAGLRTRYLTGRSLPAACDPLFAAWSQAGGLPAELVWERVALALEQDHPGVARYQVRYLPAKQAPWLELMVAVHQRPALLLEQPLTAKTVPDPRRRQAILVRGLERLARESVQQASLLHASIAAAEDLPQALAERADAALGQALVQAGERAGLEYLAKLQPRPDNLALQQARLRAALRLRAWPQLAAWAEALPAAADALGKWRYWHGQALLRVAPGPAERAVAAHALASAATEPTLWGFLAAELLGRPPALAHRPVPVARAEVERLLASPAVARIRVLRARGQHTEARRAWLELTRLLPRSGKLTAAAAAAELGLVNESILTLARAAYWDDLQLRFPLAHQRWVRAAAEAHQLPVDWLFAVIRQESAFAAQSASPAGAVGLMQLMPATAREVAEKLGLPAPERTELIEPALNIRLGSAYLAEMAQRFDGHPLVATAAYNAGPGAVRGWLPAEPIAGDLWLTEIPYAETRQYVRRVLTYRVFYRERLGLPPLRIGALLRPVSADP